MWVPTQSTAIETSARHDETRHRADAAERARRTAATLAEKGDHQGHAVWSQVADSVERLRQPPRPRNDLTAAAACGSQVVGPIRIGKRNEPAGGSSEGESLGDEPRRLALSI
jgi:predicted N-acetyltransferase YhbS